MAGDANQTNGREPHATNELRKRIEQRGYLPQAPLPRSGPAAIRAYHAHMLATARADGVIDAIADLPVCQRAGLVMAIFQGVIDRCGEGQARGQFLEGMFGLILHRIEREIEINATALSGERE